MIHKLAEVVQQSLVLDAVPRVGAGMQVAEVCQEGPVGMGQIPVMMIHEWADGDENKDKGLAKP